MMTSPIVCTSDTCWGAPRLEGTRLTVEAVVGRFVAGESIAELAADYEISTWEIESMVRAVCAAAYGRHGILMPIYRRMQQQASR